MSTCYSCRTAMAAMLAEYIFLNSSLLSLYVHIKILYHTCYYLYMMQIKHSESESESESESDGPRSL